MAWCGTCQHTGLITDICMTLKTLNKIQARVTPSGRVTIRKNLYIVKNKEKGKLHHVPELADQPALHMLNKYSVNIYTYVCDTALQN